MKLKNFKPYNQFDYFDCYYKAMFHIMDYFDVDIYGFLLNHLYAYGYRGEDKFSFFLCPFRLDEDLLKHTNLINEKIIIKENPILQINRELDAGKPVMLRIDCYYLPFRMDTYKKRHVNHYICIYGFDNKKKVFNVIDHDYINSFEYKEQELSYNALEKYINNYVGDELYFSAFSKDVTAVQLDISYMHEYSKIVTKNKDILYKGVEQLDDFVQFFINGMTGCTVEVFVEKVMLVIVNVTRCVKQREDLLKAYIFDLTLLKYMDDISRKWTIIRSFLLKYMRYDENKRKELISDICNYSKEVFELEREFNNRLIQYCMEKSRE